MASTAGRLDSDDSDRNTALTYTTWELPAPGRHEMVPFVLTFYDSRTEREFDTIWKTQAAAQDRGFLKAMEVVTVLALVRVLLQGVGWEYVSAIGTALLLLLISHGVRRFLGERGVARWRVTIVMIERSVAIILHSYSTLRLSRLYKTFWFEFLMIFFNISGIATQTIVTWGLGLKFIHFPLHFLGSLWYFFFFANDTCTMIMKESLGEVVLSIVNFISKCCAILLGSWEAPQSSNDDQEYYPCQHLFVGLHLIFGVCLTGLVIWENERRCRERFLAAKLARGESIDQKSPPLLGNLGYPGFVAVLVVLPPFFIAILWFIGGAAGILVARHGLKFLE